MKNVLLLGGTRYLGLELIKLLDINCYDFYVASRKKINVKNFIKIDRKNKEDLHRLFENFEFDIIVDFINYSNSDSKILIDCLRKQNTHPKLILISSTYVYGLPLELKVDSSFNEKKFQSLSNSPEIRNRDEISYSVGKKDMENYCLRYYDNSKLVIVRFPIILGAGDYTKRTHFYIDKIKINEKINPKNIHKIGSYVLVSEAATSIFNFIGNEYFGIYNVISKNVSEYELVKLYCNFYKTRIDSIIDSSLKHCYTPFTSNYDFSIDDSKYRRIFPLEKSFKKSLESELVKI